jgi:hypothetical protein
MTTASRTLRRLMNMLESVHIIQRHLDSATDRLNLHRDVDHWPGVPQPGFFTFSRAGNKFPHRDLRDST